ncbi:hypothetical protein CWB41_13810 [Methylovirgula ligni]|uniref:Uncharacterized protein n=1 Tax=Methylovirgula ligni TaxID=569860 RepID=A0A3D9YN28_9HYPH|nr:hypothetical protein [Methylovirgula ligni]QAY96669.1 hypothetical protein CWB41_13810 [Methylovirgula ligni]REF83291.1 hypothetical protein DES32_3207 [Methylovirgula ligni]
MKLSELIASVGDDKVEMQNLDEVMISADYSMRRGSHITFGTPRLVGLDGNTDKLGLVVWLDRDAVKAAIAAEKKGGQR